MRKHHGDDKSGNGFANCVSGLHQAKEHDVHGVEHPAEAAGDERTSLGVGYVLWQGKTRCLAARRIRKRGWKRSWRTRHLQRIVSEVRENCRAFGVPTGSDSKEF